MSLRQIILDKNLPTDDDLLNALVQAKESGIYPVQHIGNALRKQILSGNGDFPFIVKRYRKTLEWLCKPENLNWVISDMDRVLKHLKQMSDWLNNNR